MGRCKCSDRDSIRTLKQTNFLSLRSDEHKTFKQASPEDESDDEADEYPRTLLQLPRQRQYVSFNRGAFDYYRFVAIHSQVRFSNHPPAPVVSMNYALNRGREEPMWLHMIASIGAAWQARLPIIQTSFAQPLDMGKYDVALETYRKGLCEFKRLVDSLTEFTIEPVIIAAFELFAFELAIGNHVNAIHYLRWMKAIFRAFPSWCAAVTRPGSPLASMTSGSLSRLDDTSMPHRADPTPWNTRSIDDRMALLLANTLSHSNVAFSSVDEASAHLESLLHSERSLELELQRNAEAYVEKILQRCIGLRETLSLIQQQCLRGCVSRVVHLTPAASQRRDECIRGYAAWNAAFTKFERSQGLPSSAMLFLQIRAFVSYFSVRMSRKTKERECDQYEEEFDRIVARAEEYSRLRKFPRKVAPGSPFRTDKSVQSNILEWGMLRALYLICIKCRKSTTRRAAKKLLSLAGLREGPLESSTLVQYARAVIALEEGRSGSFLDEGPLLPGLSISSLPEHARFADVAAVNLSPDAEKFQLVCGSFMHESKGQVRLATYTCHSTDAWDTSTLRSTAIKKESVVEIPQR